VAAPVLLEVETARVAPDQTSGNATAGTFSPAFLFHLRRGWQPQRLDLSAQLLAEAPQALDLAQARYSNLNYEVGALH